MLLRMRGKRRDYTLLQATNCGDDIVELGGKAVPFGILSPLLLLYRPDSYQPDQGGHAPGVAIAAIGKKPCGIAESTFAPAVYFGNACIFQLLSR